MSAPPGAIAKCHGAAHVAAQHGKVRTLELLHSMDPESLRRCAADGRTPAHWAALSGQVAALGTLASLVPDTLAAHARNGATPAHDAAFQGQSHVLLHLHQINPNSLMAKSKTGATPAHDAAFSGHIETMLLLRELAPESLSARDLHGRSAAHAAAETGQESLLRLLYLLVPATLHARDGAGWLPEDVAEAHGWESTARLLKSLPPVQCDDPGSADDASDDVEQVGLEEDAPPEPEPTREDPAPSEPKAPEVTELQEATSQAEPEHPQQPANEETSVQEEASAAEPPEEEPTRSAQVSDESVLEEGKSMEPVTPDPLAYEVLLDILSASDLRNADWSLSSSGGSDSYCLVEIPGSNKGFQTEVVENSSDPVWNKRGKLVLAPEEVLLFKVMDRDDGDADDLLGKVSLPVAKLLPDGFEGQLEMQETGKATAFLTVRSKVLRALYDAAAVADALKASQSQPKRPPPPKPPKVHEIELTVRAAKGLRNADWSFGGSGGSDAYVAVSVPGTKKEFQTPVVEDSSDPEWNFVQKLAVSPKETLVFKVFDRDKRNDELLGTANLAISGILPQGFSGALKLQDTRNPTTAELLVSVRVSKSAEKS
ncbi:Espn [Symbiodinium sp. CCMP2592]|nr:Espn [Symbiodinium sp. CCMP2592]